MDDALARGLRPGEHSLEGASGIAVDADGRIFVSTFLDETIQAYGPDGSVLWAAPVDAWRGAVELRMTADGVLEAATARNRVIHRYSPATGELLGTRPRPDDDSFLSGNQIFETTTPDGVTYRIGKRSIYRIPPQGEAVAVVSQPEPPVTPSATTRSVLGATLIFGALLLPFPRRRR